jgi:hypothetical protein
MYFPHWPLALRLARVGCAGFAYIFFRFKVKKIPYFSISFALSKYERCAGFAYIYFASKGKKKHFYLIFALSEYERRILSQRRRRKTITDFVPLTPLVGQRPQVPSFIAARC